jgi:hypothetical protein
MVLACRVALPAWRPVSASKGRSSARVPLAQPAPLSSCARVSQFVCSARPSSAAAPATRCPASAAPARTRPQSAMPQRSGARASTWQGRLSAACSPCGAQGLVCLASGRPGELLAAAQTCTKVSPPPGRPFTCSSYKRELLHEVPFASLTGLSLDKLCKHSIAPQRGNLRSFAKHAAVGIATRRDVEEDNVQGA